MTWEEIINSNKAYLVAEDITEILDISPNAIRNQAHECPEKLGFRVTVTGTRVRIPRIPFMEHFGIKENNESGDIKLMLQELKNELLALRNEMQNKIV